MNVSEETVIVEFKFRMGMPVLFKELVEGFALNAKRLSKYRLAAVKLGLVEAPAPEEPATVTEPAKIVCLNS